jgi:predicted dehydrogenase
MHSAVTVSALEAGKHVFCQARMSMDLAEAEEMLAVSKRFPELMTMLCPPPYGMRADLLIKKLLAENFIGKPHDVRMQSFNGQYLNPEAPAHWRQKIEISGLNILTLGIYVEVMQRWLGDIVAVFARGKILTAERRGYHVIVPDMLNVLCVFENGAEGVLEFSGVHAGAPNDRLRIFGDRGALLYDFSNERVRSVKYGGREMEDIEVPKDLVTEWSVENDFIAAVKSKGRIRPRPSFEDGVRYMRVVQAVADSRARNEWVPIKK